MKTSSGLRGRMLAPLLAFAALLLFILDSLNIDTSRFMSYTLKDSK
jgi:hypothetical protein